MPVNDCTENHSIIPAAIKVGDMHFLISMNKIGVLCTETITKFRG